MTMMITLPTNCPPPSPTVLFMHVIVVFTILGGTVIAFSPDSRANWSPISSQAGKFVVRSRSHGGVYPGTQCRYSDLNDTFANEEIPAAKTPWTLTEDWALADGVRAFTVTSSDEQHCYTFWHRIVRMNPQLQGRSARDAHERYKFIQSDRTYKARIMPAGGPSPVMLHDWWVHVDEQVVGMGGTLDEGRSVWFPVRSLGHFDGHALDAFGIPPPCLSAAAVPGGYAEAIGGAVYELGRPRVRREGIVATETSDSFVATTFRQTATATLAALAAVSLLSVAVGFGAGLALSTERHPAMAQGTSRVYPTRSEMRAKTSQSLSEIRARQEVRVLQEKRILRTIEGRIEGDEARLVELQKLERAMQNGNNLLP